MKKSAFVVPMIAIGISQAASAMSGVSFSYAPQEFNSQVGVASVYERIEQTARSSCSSDYKVYRSFKYQNVCKADIVSKLVEQIDNPRLTALHSGDANQQFASR